MSLHVEPLDLVGKNNSTGTKKIRLLNSDAHKHFWCILTHQSALLYHKISRKVIIILPDALSSIDIIQMENGSVMLYGVIGDEVVGHDITSHVEDVSGSRKKRLPTSGGDATSLPASKKYRTRSRDQVQDDVFDVSLDDTEMGDPESSREEVVDLFGESVFLNEGVVLYRDDQLTDCMLLDGVLVALSKCPGGCIISSHPLDLQNRIPSSIPSKTSPLPTTNTLSSYFLQGECELLSKRTSLANDDWVTGVNGPTRVNQTMRTDHSYICGSLLMMSSMDNMTLVTGCLQPVIFRHLFGFDVAGLNSKIVLLGTVAGKVLWVPLKRTGQMSVSGHGVPNIFYDLHEPVVLVASIKLSAVNQGNAEGHDSLIFLGKRGKLVIVRCEQEGGGKTRFVEKLVEGCVTSPVIINDNCIVYSTLRGILTVKIELVSHRGGELLKHPDVRLTEVRYPLNRIVSLAKLPGELSGSDIELVTCSSSGTVSTVHLDDSSQMDDAITMTTHQCGQRMKELMLSVRGITTRTGNLRLAVRRQNADLSEVTQAGHLARLLMEDARFAPDYVPPFDVCFHVSHVNNSPIRSEALRCTVWNRSEWTFCAGWSLCAYAHNASRFVKKPQTDGQESHGLSRPTVSVAHPIKTWKPNTFIDLSFSIDDGNISASSPILVEFSLHFLPSSLVEGFSRHFSLSPSNATGVLLPVASRRVDILDFLQPVEFISSEGRGHLIPGSTGRGDADQGSSVAMETDSREHLDWLAHTLQVISSQKQGIILDEGIESSKAMLRTSSLLLSQKTREEMLPKGTGLLQWLFQDNLEVTSALPSLPAMDFIQLFSPASTKVHFIQTELDNSELELQIHTTSPMLFAQIWEAVHFKLYKSPHVTERELSALQLDTDKTKLLSSIKVIEWKLGNILERLDGQLQEGELEEVYEDLRKLNLKI